MNPQTPGQAARRGVVLPLLTPCTPLASAQQKRSPRITSGGLCLKNTSTRLNRDFKIHKGQIPGLLDITVHTEGLPSSNMDVMLDSTFADAASLKAYATHPAHVAVADGKVRPFTAQRACLDFEV